MIPNASLVTELRHPLNLAGLLTWATVAVELALNPNLPRGAGSIALIAVLMLAFVAGMFLCTVADHRQRPRVAIGLIAMQALAVLGMTLLVPSFATLVLSVILMAQLAHRVPTRAVIAFALVLDVALYLVLTLRWEASGAIITVLLFGGFQAFAVLTSLYAARAEAAHAQIAQINAQLLATRTLLADSARDQERLRLARELHDVAGHKLTALKLNLTALARSTPDVALAAQLADELLGDIRAVVREMRHAEGIDIGAAIAQLAAPLPRLAVHVALEASVDSVTQAETIVRAAQEALTNAARHAGAANVWIVLRRDGAGLHLDVRDDGRGSGPIEFGAGLLGMRERFVSLGGGLDVGRGEHGGLALHGWMPA